MVLTVAHSTSMLTMDCLILGGTIARSECYFYLHWTFASLALAKNFKEEAASRSSDSETAI